jgi:RNA polymerase sigma factor (sigma-70 family)
MIKILIVDDHPIILQGLERVISITSGMIIADKAENGEEAIQKIKEKEFDIVLLDISMPGENGLQVLKKIKEIEPELGVIILSIHSEEQYAVNALRSGASAYIHKMSDPNTLLTAVKKVANGEKFISPVVAETLANYVEKEKPQENFHEKLSPRETEVMKLLSMGKDAQKIAEELCISVKTVRTYKTRLMKKLNVENDAQLTIYAMNNDLL